LAEFGDYYKEITIICSTLRKPFSQAENTVSYKRHW